MKRVFVFLLILVILTKSYHSNTADGTLRLYGGGTNSGTLQIYHNGIWKSICDDGWNAEESLVACRQLGFINYVSYHHSSYTYYGFWLDDVVCTGNEEKIVNCQNNGWGDHNCGSSEGIYLKCIGPIIINPTTACVGDQITVSCRLNVPNYNDDDFFSNLTSFIVGDSDIPISQFSVEGTGFHGGVDLSKLTATAIGGTTKSVEGTITLISYTPEDNGIRLGCANDYYINGDTSNRETVLANTTIQQALPPSTPTVNIYLSYLSTDNYSALISWSSLSDKDIDERYIYRDGIFLAVTNNTEYTDTDQLLVDTVYSYSVIANSCAGNSTQGIKNINIMGDGTLSLSGGGTYFGKLKIFHNGRWKDICSGGWGREESLVACRQLGFLNYVSYRSGRYSYSGFWLDNVVCTGNEEKIINCQNNGWGIHDCYYTQAVYLTCRGKVSLIINPTTACIGDQITVNCTLIVPNSSDDDFFSVLTNFIVGDSDIPISQFSVEGTGFHGGVDLSKLTATAIGGTTKSVKGTITLISYTLEDNGIRLGCANDYYINGDTSNRGNVSGNIAIQQALPPSTPAINIVLSYLSPNNSNSLISWSSPDSDKTIDTYYIYRDGTLIAVTNNTEYTDTDQLLADAKYSYSVIANSCAGNSTQGIKNITIERDGTLRFYGGGTNSGILEIFHNGRWGYICDGRWGREESLVACRQLGFSYYVSYSSGVRESGFFWLDDVICDGTEEEIIDCRDNGWGVHNCYSTDGIFLSCSQVRITRTEEPFSPSIATIVGPIAAVLCVPLTIIVCVALVYYSRREDARARRPANNLIGSTPTRIVRQISDTIPLRDLNAESTETRETVHANNLGNDVTDLTVMDMPPPYEEPTTTTRTNHQTPATQPNRDIVPLQPRVIEQNNSETRGTVPANNLGNDVIDLTVIDLPPPYEDV